MVWDWIRDREANGGMPKTVEAARSQALTHFESRIAAKEISQRTIYRTLDEFYAADTEPGP
jgi:hypothetical protein